MSETETTSPPAAEGETLRGPAAARPDLWAQARSWVRARFPQPLPPDEADADREPDPIDTRRAALSAILLLLLLLLILLLIAAATERTDILRFAQAALLPGGALLRGGVARDGSL